MLPQPSLERALASLTQYPAEIAPDVSPFGDLPHRLRQYLEGVRVTFHDKIDLAGATPFQQAVWEMTRAILYGETRSYGWLAQQIGKPQSTRAVGQALAKNPLPIVVPCHRVIVSDGSLGGYKGGFEMKHYLVKLERLSWA
jgi:methylated-DNA-[protein]-cysteine S-methyltransferase